ncbi:MAG: fasciclin domain-containing protein [Hyphomonadaceae bacterium]
MTRFSLPTVRALLLATAFALAPQSAALAQQQPTELAQFPQTTPVAEGGDVLDVARATGQFEIFLRAVTAAGYEETLRGEGPFTLFAPTDAAFEQMDEAELERLLAPEQRDELLAVLAYHVVPERVTTDGVTTLVNTEAASGYRVQLDGRDGLRVNDQLVVMPDLRADNGVVQGINSVLSPPVLVAER